METMTSRDERTGGYVYGVRVGLREMDNLTKPIQIEVARIVAEQIAKDILEHHYTEIMENISPQAISNMAIAEAGAKINETLNKKLPDKITEIQKNHAEVYQKGLFGGMKKIY